MGLGHLPHVLSSKDQREKGIHAYLSTSEEHLEAGHIVLVLSCGLVLAHVPQFQLE